MIDPTTKAARTATVADQLHGQPSTTTVEDDTCYRVAAEKVATPAPHAYIPTFVESTRLEERAIEPIDNSTNSAPLQVAREVMDVTWKKPFYILLTNVSNKPVQLP